MAVIHHRGGKVVQILPEIFPRAIEDFLAPVEDKSRRDEFRAEFLNLPWEIKKALNVREELTDGERHIVLDYHLLNILVHKTSR